MPDPEIELELVQREEQAARLRVAEARDRVQRSEGVSEEDHAHLHRLEEEWKHLVDRLRRARGDAKD